MKRFILAILFVSFFGFSSNVLAYDTCDANNPFVPCSYNGADFDSYIGNDNQVANFFNAVDVNYIDYHYKPYENEPERTYISILYPPPSGHFCITFLPQWPYEDLSLYYWSVSDGYEVLHNGDTTYSQTVAGYLELGGGVNPNKTLNITRSPELGGGVSDYPAGENIYCGIDSYENCEASFPLNTEVTLDAYPNEGYEFSHWEINELAMADVDGTIVVPMSEDKDVVAVFVPIFGFPLSGFTSTTVPITAVMDHSLTGGFYSVDGKDDKVEAFNGEVGDAQYGIKITDGVRGYKQQSGNDFLAGYTYLDPDNEYLFYDEHPGFDFAVVNGTNVLAPFAGRLYWATTDPVNGNPGTYGTFYIDHRNGYTTWYLHCSGLTQTVVDEIALNGYAEVTKGQHIAESSNKGTTAYHLHFEVRKDGINDEHVIDPYGWELWEE